MPDLSPPAAPSAASVAPVSAAPVDPRTLNDGAGDPPIEHTIAPEPGAPTAVQDASRAYREKLEAIAKAAENGEVAPAAEDPAAPAADGRARNPDGTFKAKDGEVAAADAPTDPATDPAAPEATAEPKVFILKGEAQRGEPDIELDVTGLPPEVLARLERSEKQGMRRVEYDAAKANVAKLRADLDAVETEIAVDTTGFVLSRIPPAKRLDLASALLLEHWNELAPAIEQLWQDEGGRARMLMDLRSGIQSRRGDVTNAVTASREAAAIRTAVFAMVPDDIADPIGSEFYDTSIALLQAKANRGERVATDTVAAMLAEHARRFFGAGMAVAPITPLARPRIAVKSPPIAAAAAGKTVVLPQDRVASDMAGRKAAFATAGAGAGTSAVQRAPGPPNETIEEASRRLRAAAGR